jgi:mannose-6-phosphate isomerase-like protein (cupin superfamily)
MDAVFKMRDRVDAPDGTAVFPFLNSRDSFSSGVPWDLLPAFSLAFGRLEGHQVSKVQIFPVVTQVTVVVSGRLRVRMKTAAPSEPSECDVAPEEAIVTPPRTFLQLENPAAVPTLLLYIVSPPYVFDADRTQVRYDDSRVFDDSWDTLARQGWPLGTIPLPQDAQARRQEAEYRVALRRGLGESK